MEINFGINIVLAVLLVSVRVGMVFMLTPLFAIGNVPVKIRVLWTMAISLMVVLMLNNHQSIATINVDELFLYALYEGLFGLALAFGVFTAFASFSFAGRVLDYQMGFGIANLIDPVTRNQEPLLGTLLNVMAVLTFFLVDGHHLLIRGIAYSLDVFPPGTNPLRFSQTEIITQFGLIFIFGVSMVAPVIFVLFLIDVAMAVAARTMPQVNMFVIGIPLKIFVGLITLAVSIGYMSPMLDKVYMSIFSFWKSIMV